ncbi:MAG: hypothetical protein JW804_07785 [Sedimentisphaerales bacterium]|nr:hypothetical protein [Sedimentisphaerales bacterium]
MKLTCQDTTDIGCQALRLHRPLIDINEFAKREGITIADVEKCSEIGILQLRKNRGKIYVVDIPVSSYENTTEIDNEVAELLRIKKPARRQSTQHKTIIPENKNQTQIDQYDLPDLPQKKSNIKPGEIKKLVDDMLRHAESIKAHTNNSAKTDNHEQNQTPAPEQSNPYIEHVVRTMHTQLNDIEKRVDPTGSLSQQTIPTSTH